MQVNSITNRGKKIFYNTCCKFNNLLLNTIIYSNVKNFLIIYWDTYENNINSFSKKDISDNTYIIENIDRKYHIYLSDKKNVLIL